MSDAPQFPLADDPTQLARLQGWSEEVYRDLLAVQRSALSLQEFDAKYLTKKAILVLDITGFTVNTIRAGAVQSFLRILDVHKVCLPVFREKHAEFVRTFADDMVALFPDPDPAVEAALEIHRRIRTEGWASPRSGSRPECCIGIGYGPVYAIGPNHAMGDEMNRASKLGEDTARGGETLVTEGVESALGTRSGLGFEPQKSDDLLFPYFRIRTQGN